MPLFKSGKKNRRTGKTRASARIQSHSLSSRLKSWRSNHSLVASQSLQRLASTPISSTMTILVLAIAITLPAIFSIAINNVTQFTGQANDNVQMSLYLKTGISNNEGMKLATDIRNWDGVKVARYVSPQEAKNSFENMSGFTEIINSLPKNPLPGVIALQISGPSLTTNKAKNLSARAAALKSVTMAKIDLEWLQKVHAIIGLTKQAAVILALLLSIGVVLVVGNTIKLSIDNRREEIIVAKLVGATNAFVRRPFLYMGLWFGLGAAFTSLALISGCKYALTSSIASLSLAYNSDIQLAGLGFTYSVSLLLVGAGLGWLGAWLAASQHIYTLESR